MWEENASYTVLRPCLETKRQNLLWTQIVKCAPSPPALRQCAPPRLAHCPTAHDCDPTSRSASAPNLCRVNCSPQLTLYITLHSTHAHFCISVHNKLVMIFRHRKHHTHATHPATSPMHCAQALPFFALVPSTGSTNGNICASCCAGIATSPCAQFLARAGSPTATGLGLNNILAPLLLP